MQEEFENAEWYYEKEGVSIGPITKTELNELINRKGLTKENLVWKNGMQDWIQADKVVSLIINISGYSVPPPLPKLKQHESDPENNTITPTEAILNRNTKAEPVNIKIGQRIIIASVLLIVFFFLPWIEIQWLAAKINYSGWDLPKLASNAKDIFKSKNQLFGTDYQLKFGDNTDILYIIPSLAGLLIYFAFRNNQKYYGYIELAIVIIVGYIFYKYFFDLNISEKYLGIGLIGTFCVGVFMFFDGIKNITRGSWDGIQKTTISLYDHRKPILIGLLSFCILYIIWNTEPEPKENATSNRIEDADEIPKINPYSNHIPLSNIVAHDWENHRDITKQMLDTMTLSEGHWYGNSQLPKHLKEKSYKKNPNR